LKTPFLNGFKYFEIHFKDDNSFLILAAGSDGPNVFNVSFADGIDNAKVI
jgi:hypothetical protein